MIPEDLSGISVDELTELANTCAAQVNDPGADVAAAIAAAADYDRIQAELASRTTGEPEPPAEDDAARLAAIRERIPAPEPVATEPETDATGDGIAAALSALAAATQAMAASQASVLASAEPLTVVNNTGRGLPPLSGLRSSPPPEGTEATSSPLVAAAGTPGVAAGAEFPDGPSLARALISRWGSMVASSGEGGASMADKVVVASVSRPIDPETHLKGGDNVHNFAAIELAVERAKRRSSARIAGIQAAGGICAPRQPLYTMPVFSTARRPLKTGLPLTTADRGGFIVPTAPTLATVSASTRTVADGATTNGSATVTSATAAFDARLDTGATISGTGIPANSTILVVTSATTVTISANATATATGVSITIGRSGVSKVITNAVDAAMTGGTAAQILAGTKPFPYIPCANGTNVDLYAITMGLEFGNFDARSWPERIEALTRLAAARQARVAETAILDGFHSTATATPAETADVGLSRAQIAQWITYCEYLRNEHRMEEDAPIDIYAPSWFLKAAATDLIRGSGYEAEFLSQARAQIEMAMAENFASVTWYIDSATGASQLVNGGSALSGSGGLNWPGTVVSYIHPAGTYVLADQARLDVGVVRDSVLVAANLYRIFFEDFEALLKPGPEALELTLTGVANGTFAGAAYGSNTVSSPVAIPTAA